MSRRAMAAKWRQTHLTLGWMLKGGVSGRVYFDRGNVSRCEQTQDAVSSKLVADGIRFARAVTSASPRFFCLTAPPSGEDLGGALILSLHLLVPGPYSPLRSVPCPGFTYPR